MPLPRFRPTRCLAAMALLVLLLGLPRALVMCTGGGRMHLEIAHAGGCCDHAHDRAHALPEPARRAGAPVAEERCEHTGFASELAPPPARPKLPTPPPPQLLAAPPWPACAPAPDRSPVLHPPATGPPRPAGRLSLRATTLLLL